MQIAGAILTPFMSRVTPSCTGFNVYSLFGDDFYPHIFRDEPLVVTRDPADCSPRHHPACSEWASLSPVRHRGHDLAPVHYCSMRIIPSTKRLRNKSFFFRTAYATGRPRNWRTYATSNRTTYATLRREGVPLFGFQTRAILVTPSPYKLYYFSNPFTQNGDRNRRGCFSYHFLSS
jgi:hypothetical protein